MEFDGSRRTFLKAAGLAGLGAVSLLPYLLRLFGRGLLRGQPWPARAAVLSVEYGSDRHTPSLKLDINVATALACDRETDTNIRRVLADLSLDHHEYDAMLRVCRCTLADGQRQILFAGLALRPGDTRVNIYAHPLPPPVE